MSMDVIEVRKDVVFFNLPFRDLVYDAGNHIIHRSQGKRNVYIVKNRYGISKKDDLLSWKNPKINRYNKIIRMHEEGKWKNVPLPKKAPVSGEELFRYVDFWERKSDVMFVFEKE